MESSYILKKDSLIDYFVVFFVFDLLFLPNFLASTPLSFFLLILFSPIMFSIKKEFILAYMLLIVFMLASAINGLTVYASGAEENLKRLIQMALVLSLIFLNFNRLNFFYVERMFSKIVFIFILYLITLLIISLISPSFYLSVMSVISPNAVEMISANVEMFRFSYMFSDPNTLGYLLVFVSIFHLFYSRKSNLSLLTYFALFFLVLSTQSRGALLAFVAVTMIILLSRSKFSLNTFKLILLFATFSALFFLVFQDYFMFIIEAFEKRSEIEEAMGTGLGGGRDKKYFYLINNFNLNLYGVGYSLFIDGLEFRPHSDLIRMILSYGIIFFLVFMSLFIPNSFRNLVLMFSFFFPFLLNSVVDDYRLFGVFVILFLFMKNDHRWKNSVTRSPLCQ